MVEDSTGQVKRVRDEIPLLLEQAVDTINGSAASGETRERVVYALPGFDHNSALPDVSHAQLIRRIAEAIHSGAAVTVTGYASTTDDGDHADWLAAVLRQSPTHSVSC